MNKEILRLRMFAGPNGSGKSTFKSIINPDFLGIFINPDEIEKEIRDLDFLNLKSYGIQTTKDEILNFFMKSQFIKSADLLDDVTGRIQEMDNAHSWMENNHLSFINCLWR